MGDQSLYERDPANLDTWNSLVSEAYKFRGTWPAWVIRSFGSEEKRRGFMRDGVFYCPLFKVNLDGDRGKHFLPYETASWYLEALLHTEVFRDLESTSRVEHVAYQAITAADAHNIIKKDLVA